MSHPDSVRSESAIFNKIFEKSIFEHLYQYLKVNNILSPCQSGFQKGDSCTSQLLSIVHEIQHNLDAFPPRKTIGIFLDKSKAFDKVWYERLLFKLKMCGVEGGLLQLFKSYLYQIENKELTNV